MDKRSGKNKKAKPEIPVVPDATLLIRIAASVLLLVLAYKLKVSSLVSVLMLIVAALVIGFDIVISAIEAIKEGRYLDTDCLLTVASVAAFDAGCFKETVIFLALYRLCSCVYKSLLKYTKNSALGFAPKDDDSYSSLLRSQEKNKGSTELAHYADIGTKAACAVALVFAVVMPLVTSMTYIMSIRRGAMLIIAVAVPFSLLTTEPMCVLFSKLYCASFGVNVKDDSIFEKAVRLKTVVFDKADVLSGGTAKISSISSPVMSKESFLKILAHTVYKSEQKIAPVLLSAYSGEIVPEFIESFSDIIGGGMEIRIGGKDVILGTKDVFDLRGISLDESVLRSGYVFYLAIGGRYVGSVVLSENTNPYAERSVEDLKRIGVSSVIVSEEGREVCEKLASAIGVSRFYTNCDTMKKLNVVKDIKSACKNGETVMYISAESAEYHSDADIDVRVGIEDELADISMSNLGIFGIPVFIDTARMMSSVSTQNRYLCLGIKLLLIILALTGRSTMWFIVLLDYVASMFSILNILRIASFGKNS